MKITQDKVFLADGAWGTELFKMGLEAGASPEEWNLTKPDCVRKIAENYLCAGSEIILTNTFGGTRFQLERHGLAGKVREINRTGAALTREACAGRALTAGDMGPSGKLFIMGEVSENELFEAFAEQAAALKEGGSEYLVVETMTDIGEMEIAVRAAAGTGLPVVASLTYEKNARRDYRTVMGHSPQDAVRAAIAAGASVIGANCGGGIDAYEELARLLCTLTELPVWIKANAGLPELVDGKPVYRMDAGIYASHAAKLLEAGVSVIGGCCGTSPEFIRKMRPLVDAWNSRS
ncbi:MAG: homocysteine S-methyltransferase family protein [Spirochaetales bacterium]|jgi:5-methyltetrahydrofolate--homocysteine methyltransferase|nr:homocysteine S-methyltransferase family protein [Spirochaetales bacterium]